MLTEEQIRQALQAHRVIPLDVSSDHGPLGLEHLAAAVARHLAQPNQPGSPARVRRPIELPAAIWEKLDCLADAAGREASAQVSASQMAAVIIEQAVAGLHE